jgi:uncharacterized protein
MQARASQAHRDMSDPRHPAAHGCATLGLVALLALTPRDPTAAGAEGPIPWQDWSVATFAQARAANKLILLDLVAVWCHWCHVMEATTYRDPAVVAAIAAHYVAVQADHDARPDLAERYRNWG